MLITKCKQVRKGLNTLFTSICINVLGGISICSENYVYVCVDILIGSHVCVGFFFS